MHIRFLCPSHRYWLNAHPEFARAHFYQCLGATQHHRKYQAWSQALMYAGSAFEAAEILLNRNPRSLSPVVSFTSAAILLSSTLNELSNSGRALHILHLCYQRLNKELAGEDNTRLRTLFRCIALISERMRDFWQDEGSSSLSVMPVNVTSH